ncbi:hypothetical protein MMC14_002901 [Varicellaria rhodocarpa]|nr:hypothetical protein [Varicellaria rhodocarpa]
MPLSPHTPLLRRRSSGFESPFTPPSTYGNGYSPKRTRSRKSSIQSFQSPITPRPTSSDGRGGDYGFSVDFGGTTNPGNGLGSLADELAEAWDEDGEVEEGASGIHMEEEEEEDTHNRHQGMKHPQSNYLHDMENGLGVVIPSTTQSNHPNGLHDSPRPVTRSKGRRKATARSYDGSDYGPDSDFEDLGDISPSLEIRMSAIESLARQGIGSYGSDADHVCDRVASALRDLSSQAGVESGATRLANAHIALTTHLTHQTRLLTSLTTSFLSPLSTLALSDPSVLLALPDLLSALLLSLPQPPNLPLPSLHALHASTADLLTTLSYLSDTLHMTRQTTTLAARRLKVARETVSGLRAEIDAAEEGVRWIEKGGWDERLRGREAAKVCAGVVGGFEEVCENWKERLIEGVGVGAA